MNRVLPVRTCVGCRERAVKSDLLRVVVTAGRVVVPDLRGGLPGRGAHLHPTPRCLDVAERRRAFQRALRLDGPPDITAVRTWIEEQGPVSTEDGRTTDSWPGQRGKRSSGS